LGLFNYSARKGENHPNLGDPNWIDHNDVAVNLLRYVVVALNVLEDNWLHFIALFIMN
jgi:hypothetical protein